MNKKARIILREGTGAMRTYGMVMLGCIKEVVMVAKDSIENSFNKSKEEILFVIDEAGERALIPCEEVASINYEF